MHAYCFDNYASGSLLQSSGASFMQKSACQKQSVVSKDAYCILSNVHILIGPVLDPGWKIFVYVSLSC